MNRYIKGIIRNLKNLSVSKFTLIDDKSVIHKNAQVYRFSKVVNSIIGRYTYIGIGTKVINVEIGQFCSIATNVYIGLESHTLANISTSPIFTEKYNALRQSWTNKDIHLSSERTIVGNDVWIGYGALIKAGVKIGDGAIIGAGAVVVKDVPPYAIVGGVPAKIIRYRFSEMVISRLLDLKWWNVSEEILKNNISVFQSPILDDEFIDKLIEKFETKNNISN